MALFDRRLRWLNRCYTPGYGAVWWLGARLVGKGGRQEMAGGNDWPQPEVLRRVATLCWPGGQREARPAREWRMANGEWRVATPDDMGCHRSRIEIATRHSLFAIRKPGLTMHRH